jgi:hypothetical protein
LLVDSGFTGESELVLSVDAEDLAWTPISSAQVTGALQGQQDRALVMCRASGLKPEWLLVAILADLSHLSLPKDVDGIVGLRFLRRFARWGAEWTADAGWQFFLTEKETAA